MRTTTVPLHRSQSGYVHEYRNRAIACNPRRFFLRWRGYLAYHAQERIGRIDVRALGFRLYVSTSERARPYAVRLQRLKGTRIQWVLWCRLRPIRSRHCPNMTRKWFGAGEPSPWC